MTGHEKARAHAPRADVARLEKNDERWSIWLDPQATIVELALLLGGIPCKLEAHQVGDEGAFALIPVEAHAPCPTAADLAALFEKGLAVPLPRLRQVEDDRIDITHLGSATDRCYCGKRCCPYCGEDPAVYVLRRGE